MLVAFLESIKYVGYFYPLVFLRVFVGYYYINQAYSRYEGDFLTHPRLASLISEWLSNHSQLDWYRSFLENIVIPQWQVFAYIITAGEFFIGISYIFGYMVRPFSILALILTWNFFFFSSGSQASSTLEIQSMFYKILLALHLTMGWLGAGRSLGLDYFFYKRRRGLWW